MLEPSEAERYYDRFGSKQDSQGFYEDPALDDLIAHAGFETARAVFELGCGTGRLAARLLSEELAAQASYVGIDVSATMVDLARKRLEAFPERARVAKSDGSIRFPVASHSVDRVVTTYVLDLLSESDIEKFLQEAHRALEVGGKLCVASLTRGTTFVSRLVSEAWTLVHGLRASWVGGCRPIRIGRFIDPAAWDIEYETVVVAYGVPSEVLVARARDSEGLRGSSAIGPTGSAAGSVVEAGQLDGQAPMARLRAISCPA